MSGVRVLCVSSEPLRPGNTLPSTFELSQAQLLIEKVDIAILAVSEYPVHHPRLEKFLEWPLSVVRSRVHRHIVEGIPVYED